MNPSIIAYFIAVVIFIIMVLFYEKFRKRKAVFWNWAGAFVFAIGLAGTILKLTQHGIFREIFAGIIFVVMGLSLYIFPKHK
ncbi:hypothetical protein HY212_06410 [Candidatus Pacearchaeota archaeon]|nr:hypothetical protein [Candidatus Pacearchaeota archaeon]